MLKKRGVKIRMVTEITDSNICHAKKMMEIAEVRHLKGVRSSFGIADGIQYLDHAISENDQLSHAIISNVKAVVEAKQYLFETLWIWLPLLNRQPEKLKRESNQQKLKSFKIPKYQ